MGAKWMRIAAAAAAMVIALAACGGDDDDGGNGGNGAGAGNGDNGNGGATVELTAVDNEFEPAQLEVPAGAEVTVEFVNDGSNPHTFTSKDVGFDTGIVDAGASKSVTFTAPDSEVEFVCTVHEAEGMTGMLVPQ